MSFPINRKLLLPATAAIAFAAGAFASSAGADQPYMHQALDQLQGARATLAAANDDKGGHRVRAMRFIDRAIGEVNAGMAYDRMH